MARHGQPSTLLPSTSGAACSDLTTSNNLFSRAGADKVSIGSDAVYAAEEYVSTGKKDGASSIELISR